MKFLSLFTLGSIFLLLRTHGQPVEIDDVVDRQESSSTPTLLTWEDAHEKANKLVDRLTLEQMVDISSGTSGPCVGNTGSVGEIFPSLCLQDAPIDYIFFQVRQSKGITAGVSAINTAASFDKKAIRQRGTYIGAEFRAKGVNVYLGPNVNMVRSPYAGRNFETFGEDPYLSGVAGVETVLGVQSQGVIAQIKHLIANEQETNRNTYSSNVGDKALHEVYMWPFEKAIKAGVGSIMCSYNKVNGSHACENDYTMNTIVKKRLSFQGFITSDWHATHSTAKSANNGLDMEMPDSRYFGSHLLDAVKKGQVKEDRVRDMAKRIVATWYKLGQDAGYPPVTVKDDNDVQGDHKKYVRSLGAASTVLLRNQDNVLPLQPSKLKSIAVIGSDAGDSLILGNSLCGTLPCLTGNVAMGGGSAAVTYPYLVTPMKGIKARAGDSIEIHQVELDIDILGAKHAAKKSNVAIVFSSVFTMESFDRLELNLNRNGDNLIEAVANANNNTIVVINSPSSVLMPWIDHPNIKAVVWAGYPGQESGNALADVLFGDVNPSGRLPFTIAKKEDDYPVHRSSSEQIDYTDGVYLGYRYFDHMNVEPLFEFGYGLSYTKFDYSNLKIDTNANNDTNMLQVSLMVENSGDVDGDEVVQLYLTFPKSAGEPPKVLRGFEKVFLKAGDGQKETVTFELGKTELSIWDIATKSWDIPHGDFQVHVGASSRDIRQSATFTM